MSELDGCLNSSQTNNEKTSLSSVSLCFSFLFLFFFFHASASDFAVSSAAS